MRHDSGYTSFLQKGFRWPSFSSGSARADDAVEILKFRDESTFPDSL
jgi:hypothetical protein